MRSLGSTIIAEKLLQERKVIPSSRKIVAQSSTRLAAGNLLKLGNKSPSPTKKELAS
jgi:hypothetical protein